jgi:hypothetical protein
LAPRTRALLIVNLHIRIGDRDTGELIRNPILATSPADPTRLTRKTA